MRKGKRLTIIGGIIIGVLAVSAVAVAASNSIKAKGITNVKVKTETVAYSTASTSWVSLPGATFKMSVPAGKQRTFIAEFDGESHCSGISGSWCTVRILVDGTEMHPRAGSNFAFDSGGADRWEGHAMTRTYGPLGPGQHTFKVQIAVANGATSFGLDDWTFKVFKANA